jgi:hypothetical protein
MDWLVDGGTVFKEEHETSFQRYEVNHTLSRFHAVHRWRYQGPASYAEVLYMTPVPNASN